MECSFLCGVSMRERETAGKDHEVSRAKLMTRDEMTYHSYTFPTRARVSFTGGVGGFAVMRVQSFLSSCR